MRAVHAVAPMIADITVIPVSEVVPGHSVVVDHIDVGLGGSAIVAAALASLDVPVHLYGCVGEDAFARLLHEKLSALNVDMSAVKTSSAAPTSVTLALVYPDGERTLLNMPGMNAHTTVDQIGFENAARDDLFYAGGLAVMGRLRGTAAGALFQKAADTGMTCVMDTTFDPRGEWMPSIAPALPCLDILFTSYGEARHYAGTDDPEAIVERFKNAGAAHVVLKLGRDGCLVDVEGTRLRVEAYPARVVDTKGAGDHFVSGYLSGLARGRSVADCARLAVACGSLSTEHVGGEVPFTGFEQVWSVASSLNVHPV